jgi:hypothetical protein
MRLSRFLVCLIFFSIMMYYWSNVPIKALAMAAVSEISGNADLYTDTDKHAPASLSQLPMSEGCEDPKEDSCNKNMICKYDPNNKSITLRTRGKDKIFGTGDDLTLTLPLGSKNMAQVNELFKNFTEMSRQIDSFDM